MLLLNFSHPLTPVHLRMRPISGVVPPRYEVAEVINLQQIRDEAREKR